VTTEQDYIVDKLAGKLHTMFRVHHNDGSYGIWTDAQEYVEAQGDARWLNDRRLETLEEYRLRKGTTQ